MLMMRMIRMMMIFIVIPMARSSLLCWRALTGDLSAGLYPALTYTLGQKQRETEMHASSERQHR